MYRKLFYVMAILALMVIQIGCGKDDNGNGNGPEPVVEPRLVAASHQDPTFENALDTLVWDSINAVELAVGTQANSDYNANVAWATNLKAEMKALVADDSVLYIWVRWNDNDVDNRFGQLHATWANFIEWEIVDTSEYNEDRFYIMFDNGAAEGADCAQYCHTSQSIAGRKFYGTGIAGADIWQWKANRTGLAKYAEDMHITDTMISQDPQHSLSDSLYFGNLKSTVPKPIKMHHTDTLFTGPGLLESEAPGGNFVLYDDTKGWIVFPEDTTMDWIGKYMPGYHVYDVTGADGSRWDVRAVSEHDGSHWTAVFRRSLMTVDSDDVDLSSIDSVQITIAITNNSGIKHHGHKPFYLVFERD